MYIKFFECKNQKLLSVNFAVPVGTKTIYRGELNSFAHFMEHLIFHGHPDYNQYELMLRIEEMGGVINAHTNCYYTELYLRIKEEYLIEALELICGAIKIFDIRLEDYEAEKEIIKAEEVYSAENSYFHVEKMLDRCFEGVVNGVIPEFEEIRPIYHELYDRWSIYVIGDIGRLTKQRAEQLYDAAHGRDAYRNHLFSFPMRKKNCFVDKKTDEQSVFAYVHRCSVHTGVLEMRLIQNLYVNGLASILYERLVVEENICYSIRFNYYLVGNKFFVIYFTCKPEGIEYLEPIFEDVFSKEYVLKISDSQISRALNTCYTDFLLRKERKESIFSDIVEAHMLDKIIMTDRVIDKIEDMEHHKVKKMMIQTLFSD